MNAEAVFDKELSRTDIEHRLSFPSEHLDILPVVAAERDPINFRVRCGARIYRFRCIKRQTGPVKPVIESGWSSVVYDNNLQPGDLLKFYYVEASEHEAARYWIEVFRWVEYNDPIGTSRIRHRIV